MNFQLLFVILCIQVYEAVAYNVDAGGSGTTTIRPYNHTGDEPIKNPTFFGYDFSIKTGSSETPK